MPKSIGMGKQKIQKSLKLLGMHKWSPPSVVIKLQKELAKTQAELAPLKAEVTSLRSENIRLRGELGVRTVVA